VCVPYSCDWQARGGRGEGYEKFRMLRLVPRRAKDEVEGILFRHRPLLFFILIPTYFSFLRMLECSVYLQRHAVSFHEYLPTFFLMKPTNALISQIYIVKNLYMFRAVPLPIMRSFPLYIRHWYMSCRFDDSFQTRLVVLENYPNHVEFLDEINFGI
jgi:hypothetical protein